jgi:hypothetical protein
MPFELNLSMLMTNENMDKNSFILELCAKNTALDYLLPSLFVSKRGHNVLD